VKPTVLNNERYREKIEALYKIKDTLHVFDRIAIEDVKYRLDINNPLEQYDIAWLDLTYRRYLE
jgi:hypothetical protein